MEKKAKLWYNIFMPREISPDGNEPDEFKSNVEKKSNPWFEFESDGKLLESLKKLLDEALINIDLNDPNCDSQKIKDRVNYYFREINAYPIFIITQIKRRADNKISEIVCDTQSTVKPKNTKLPRSNITFTKYID